MSSDYLDEKKCSCVRLPQFHLCDLDFVSYAMSGNFIMHSIKDRATKPATACTLWFCASIDFGYGWNASLVNKFVLSQVLELDEFESSDH